MPAEPSVPRARPGGRHAWRRRHTPAGFRSRAGRTVGVRPAVSGGPGGARAGRRPATREMCAVSDQACLAQGLPVGSLRVRRQADQTLGSDA